MEIFGPTKTLEKPWTSFQSKENLGKLSPISTQAYFWILVNQVHTYLPFWHEPLSEPWWIESILFDLLLYILQKTNHRMRLMHFTPTDNLNWPNRMDGRVHSVLKGLILTDAWLNSLQYGFPDVSLFPTLRGGEFFR